ncbi:MAG: thiamine pyrophosphate-binding protein [Paracoccaceae bacterium]
MSEQTPNHTSPNHTTGAEALVRLLADHGVRHIFGLCGDTSLPFYDALARLDHGMTHILTRDERHAAYMADAYARLTRRVGICEGPSGGGATYIAPGLVEANDSSVPVLAITSDVATTSAGRYPLTKLDQQALFRPLTKWNAVLDSAAALPRTVRRAFREMTTGRPGSAHLALPFDVQKAEVPEDEIWADAMYGQFPAMRGEMSLETEQVTNFAEALMSAKAPVIVCGGGVVLSGAERELQHLAETLNIPVATTVSGQGSIAETHPNAVGVVGSNGGRPGTRAVVDAADCVVFLGCRAGSVTTERWRSPAPGATILHIDCDPGVFGASYPTHAAWLGDIRTCLEGLNEIIDALNEPRDFNGAATAANARAAKETAFRALADSAETPIKPERVIDALNRLCPPETVVCADPGTPCPYFSAYWTIQQPGRHFITNRAHGALGYALGAAIGAQVARPTAKVICATGDGSFGMSVGEFETITRYRLPITTIVFSNSVFGWIKAGQKSGFGGRYFSVDFNRTDHAAVAAAYGVKSWRVEDPGDLDRVLKEAIAHDGPTLVDVIVQPLQDAEAPVSEWVA